MLTVERHPAVFDTRVQTAYKMQLAGLPRALARAPAHPDVLATVMDMGHALLAYGLGLGAPTDELQGVLRQMGEAGAALFTAATTPSGAARVKLNGEVVDIRALGQSSVIHPGRWEEAFAFAAAAGDADALDLLSRVPVRLLESGSTSAEPFLSRWVEALGALWRRQPVGPALQATRQAAAVAKHALAGAVTARLALCDLAQAVEAGDPGPLEAAIQAALTAHRAFWGEPARAKLPQGLIAWQALGLTAIARERGVTVAVSSDYLPLSLLRR